MKYQLAVLMLAAGLANAGEVEIKIPKKSALVVEHAYDGFAPDRVTVKATNTGQRNDNGVAMSKTISAEVGGSSFGPATVECYYFVEGENPKFHPPRVLVAGRAETTGAADTFVFTAKSSHGDDDIKGWFVRVVRSGHIVGIAGSSPKFEAMAADPKTAVLYGQR